MTGTWNVRTLFKTGVTWKLTQTAEMETSILQDQWEQQETDGRMWSRGMHYNCWG